MYCGMLVVLTAMSCQQRPDTDKAALARLNAIRESVGLAPVTLDPTLSKGCTAHAQYLIRNYSQPSAGSITLNAEESNRPGYSEAGHKAAQAGIVRPGLGPLGTVEWTMATFIGRALLLRPDLKRVGMGTAYDTRKHPLTVLDIQRGRGMDRPIIYPADKQKDVPLAFVGPEDPNPLPKGANDQAGFPITVTFPATSQVQNGTAALTDADGKEVPCWLSTPEKPAINAAQQFNTVCLIPKEWLKADTSYTVRASATVAGASWNQTWKFQTGSRAKPERGSTKQPIDVLNGYRQLAGAPPVVLDADSTEGSIGHAEYLLKNIDDVIAKKIPANDEDPKRAGYTARGHKTARTAFSLGEEPVTILDAFMAGFTRRFLLLHPDLSRVGIGYAKSERVPHMTVLDVQRGREQADVMVYPPDKSKGVPLLYASLGPDPLDSKDKRAGYPVTVIFPSAPPIQDVTATLHDKSGKAVPMRLFAPQQTTLKPEQQGNTICLIARDPLKPNMTYTVSVQTKWGEERWTKKWSFTTAPR
jgi:uncharacterized protein YkwD